MPDPVPVPTQAPQANGINFYAPMSSQVNPLASNYINTAPMSVPNSSNQLNAFGAPLYSTNAWNTTTRVANTDPLTGELVTQEPTPQPGPAPSQPSQPSAEDQLKSELDSIFNPVFSALAGQESTLGQNYAITNRDINANYDTSAQGLAKQNVQGQEQLNQLGTEAGKTKSDAWTQATRLYNELTRGGQQRYGGASSAGEAFNTLTAVEQQRRQSTIQSAYDESMQKVASYKANLESQYEQTAAQLEQDRNSALADAQKEFNSAWQQIQSNKSQAQSDKASATLNSLNDYRNKVYTINMQAVQFAQALAANKQASISAVDKYTQQVMNNLASGNQTYQSLSGTLNNAANTTSYGKTGVGMASTGAGITGATTGSYFTWDPTSGTYKKVTQ